MTPATPTDTAETPTDGDPAATDAGPENAESSAPAEEASAPTAEDGLEGAEGLKEAVSAQSETAASLIETLDSWAMPIGESQISVWDGLVAIGVLVLVFMGAWMITRLCAALLKRATKLDGTQQLLAQKISTILVWAAAFFVGIDLLGIDLTAFAVFSGAFGLAIGFGLQKTFGNLIAGIILLMDKSIKPGDVISVTDQAGQESFGQIRKIGIRAISVITRDRTEYLIPNENLMINQVVNWSYSSRDVRVKVPVGVSYTTDMNLTEDLLLQAAKDTPRVLKYPAPRAFMVGFGDSSVDWEIRFWIEDPEDGLGNVRSDVLKRVWDLFLENKIEIPFPQRDLNLRTNEQFDRLIEALAVREENRNNSDS